MKKIRMTAVAFFVLSVLVCWHSVSFAAIPKTLNFQAKLTDKDGAPLSGNYDIKLDLYTIPAGGASIWEETHNGVVVSEGIANIILGSQIALDLPFDKPYYLEISIQGEKLPQRQLLSSSAYSL